MNKTQENTISIMLITFWVVGRLVPDFDVTTEVLIGLGVYLASWFCVGVFCGVVRSTGESK